MADAEPDDDEVTERAMMQIEAAADAWMADTPEIRQTIARLARMAPQPFRDLVAAQIDALMRVAYHEAFYSGFNAHKDHAAAVRAETRR